VLLAAPEETVIVLPAPSVAPVAEAEPEIIVPAPVAELDTEPAVVPAVEPAVEPSVVPAVEPEPVVVAAAAPEPALPDDLTRIEGIGPKMDAALKAAGITTFARLAETSEDELRAAIAVAGMRFAPSVGTWPQQASYAARGDWSGLAVFQSSLISGRR
jgi:predicted flap endonuclease-1-like 5' DNA nuclease